MPDPTVDIADLEMAFAKDPTSSAFLALSAAYLEQGRFMEAMVVCKKGIKSQPDNIQGRLLLAKVYAGQGKVPKAIDEVKSLIELAPTHADGHVFLGQLHERSGRFEEAIASFKEALKHNADHAEAIAALKAKGIEIEKPKPPEPPPPPVPEPVAAEPVAADGAHSGANGAAGPAAPASLGAQPPGAATPATGVSSSPPRPAPRPRPQPHGQGAVAAGAYASPIMGGYDPLAEAHTRKKGLGLGFTVGLGGVLLVVLALFVAILVYQSRKAEEIKFLLGEARKSSHGGNTAGLVKSVQQYEEALKKDEDQEQVLAELAYYLAVLTFERGMGGEIEEKAKKYTALAEKEADDHQLTLAASMMRALYFGKMDDAAKVLVKIEKDLGDGQPKPVLNVARGMYLRRAGKLTELSPVLESLRNTATDPSHLSWLGFAYRALGDRVRARLALDQAIKTKGDNDPARAQRALLLFEEKDIGNIPIALDDLTTLQDLGKASVGEKQWGYMSIGRAELNRFNQREQEYTQGIDLARRTLGKDADLSFFEAKALMEQEKHTEAMAKLEEATRLDRYRVIPWATYVMAATDAGKGAEAEKALGEAKTIFPDALELISAEVYYLAKNRQLSKARTMLEAKLAQKDDPEIRRELGRVLLAEDKGPEAQTELQKSAEQADKSKGTLVRASIYTLLGRAIAKNGDDNLALESFGQAVSINAGYSEAYYYLGQSAERVGKPTMAREAYQKYVKLDPSGSKNKASRERLDALR